MQASVQLFSIPWAGCCKYWGAPPRSMWRCVLRSKRSLATATCWQPVLSSGWLVEEGEEKEEDPGRMGCAAVGEAGVRATVFLSNY